MKKAKTEKKVTPFFNENVEVYFRFYETKFGLKPSFDGSAPRDLKQILDAMKKLSDDKQVEWTLDISKRMMLAFLQTSYNDVFFKDNFLLFLLNRHKDKIFLKIKSQIDGTSKAGFTRDGVMEEFARRNYKQRD